MNGLTMSFLRSFSSMILSSKRPTMPVVYPKALLSTSPISAIKYYQNPNLEERGIQLYQLKDGTRGKLKDAEDRFKRLDWGIYIRPKTGRRKKMYKRFQRSIWRSQQHVFTVKSHTRDLNKMMDDETKRIRYFPDDIYQKYNKLAFHEYHWTKLKNAELIKRFGNKVYLFDRFKAHRSIKGSRFNVCEKQYYEPPGYHEVVKDKDGVYVPDQTKIYPTPTIAPHFARDPIQVGGNCRKLIELRNYEQFFGQKIKPWNPIIRNRVWLGSKR